MFGIDRQVYYRKIKRRFNKQNKARLVVDMVLETRQQMPRIGAKKLYYLLHQDLRILKIGRDKFIDILRANHLLITPKRSYHITTNSHHRFRKYNNQIVDLEINKPEQVWVSDITYIGKREKPCYLSLITDAYSKKIVGYNVSDNLNTESSLVALRLAIKQRKKKDLVLIHHSDRGLQYCANEYQKLLSKNRIKPSMTQNSDPYENAVAERINRTLKYEYGLKQSIKNTTLAKKIVKRAVNIYNNLRPHLSLELFTPKHVHLNQNVTYKCYRRNKQNLQYLTI